MSLLDHALRGAAAPARPGAAARIAVVAGAGGALGSAVLERALAYGAFQRVRALVHEPVAAAMRGFEALPLAALEQAVPPADTAFVVFDRERHANGREAAFMRPQPQELVPLAARLHAAGVRSLVVVLPHAPARLPQALQRGLANLDEHAVAALGFERVVFVRSAAAPAAADTAAQPWPARLARALLSQLHWLVPEREQPVRAAKVADFVARVALRLPQAAPGTRVAPPELVWMAAQRVNLARLVDDWLLRGRIPATPAEAG